MGERGGIKIWWWESTERGGGVPDGGNEQIFGWWGDSPSKENPDKIANRF